MAIQINAIEHVIKILVISLEGRLDEFETPALRKMCDDYLDSGIIHFVFDLSLVTMLDSSGLAVLISVLKRTRLKDGDVRLIFPTSPDAMWILKLTKFDQVFKSIEPSQIIPEGF